METINEDICFLKTPANFIITGVTGSGKTCFLLKLLKDWPFQARPGRMLYFYNTWQTLFEDFIKEFPEMTFVQGLCLEKIEDLQAETGVVNVVVTDDLMDKAVKSDEFGKLFTVFGHHKSILNFFISQNPFLQGPLATTLNRNCHYFVLLKSPHLNVLNVLGSQLYGNGSPLKEAYLKSMNEKPYSYLLVDVFCDKIQDRLRSNIMKKRPQ